MVNGIQYNTIQYLAIAIVVGIEDFGVTARQRLSNGIDMETFDDVVDAGRTSRFTHSVSLHFGFF